MEKRESFKPEEEIAFPPPKAPSSRFAGIADKLFGITKFILGICLLPFVYAVTIAFIQEVGFINPYFQKSLWAGVIVLLATYLFVWEPAALFGKGQNILEFVFRFIKPLVKVAPAVLPIYTILVFVFGLIAMHAIKESKEYVVFLLGFTLALHLVYSAKSMRTRKGDFLKSNYIFGFSFIYIINIGLMALFLAAFFDTFSFIRFFQQASQSAVAVFHALFTQLFST